MPRETMPERHRTMHCQHQTSPNHAFASRSHTGLLLGKTRLNPNATQRCSTQPLLRCAVPYAAVLCRNSTSHCRHQTKHGNTRQNQNHAGPNHAPTEPYLTLPCHHKTRAHVALPPHHIASLNQNSDLLHRTLTTPHPTPRCHHKKRGVSRVGYASAIRSSRVCRRTCRSPHFSTARTR